MAGPRAGHAPQGPGDPAVTGPEDDAVEHEIWINARPETIWRYWTDPARICDWWGASAELDPRPGGTCLVRLGGGPGRAGEVVWLVPSRPNGFHPGWGAARCP